MAEETVAIRVSPKNGSRSSAIFTHPAKQAAKRQPSDFKKAKPFRLQQETSPLRQKNTVREAVIRVRKIPGEALYLTGLKSKLCSNEQIYF